MRHVHVIRDTRSHATCEVAYNTRVKDARTLAFDDPVVKASAYTKISLQKTPLEENTPTEIPPKSLAVQQ